MYERYWRFRDKPFENDQNIDFFYYSRDHREALVRLIYAIRELKGLVLLTGDAGCGKTFVLSNARRELLKRGYKVALVSSPARDSVDLLRQIALEFGIRKVEPLKSEIVFALRDYFGYHLQQGAASVLMVDDADTIDDERTLEELKLLLNLEKNGRPLVQLVLAGQPRLRAQLKRIASLNQRVGQSYHLSPLSEEDANGYIGHRLRAVNGSRRIFDPRAIREIYRSSRGVPRLINNLCDLSLLIACSERRGMIDPQTVGEAREEFKEFGLETQ